MILQERKLGTGEHLNEDFQYKRMTSHNSCQNGAFNIAILTLREVGSAERYGSLLE